MEGKRKKFLSDTFIDLINPAPLPFDPELEYSESAAKVVENEGIYGEEEEENVSSTLRKRKFDFLEDVDQRYVGRKVSRKFLGMDKKGRDSDIEQSGEEKGSDSDIEQSGEADTSSSNENEVESDANDDSYENSSRSEDGDVNSKGNSSDEDKISSVEDNKDNFQHISNRSTDLEVERGIAVRNQLTLWDSLLECRITLQKTLIAANKLPQHEIFGQFLSQGGSKYKSEIHRTKNNIATLLEKCITFQTIMLKSYPETKQLDKIQNGESRESDEEINSETEGEEEHLSNNEDEDEEQKKEKHKTNQRSLKEYAKLLSEQHEKYKNYRNATIQKWNDKTRISIGKLSSRNFSSFEQSTLKQIEQVLSNRQRLLERTQLKRSSYNILGQELVHESDKKIEESVPSVDTNDLNSHDRNKEYDTEIFDDTDFYHQLLRDLIEKKSSDVTDPIQLGRQWLKLQKLRSKMKRKIDTRATKGRKIRYAVHPKLVNFMASEDRSVWTEEAKSELFTSLFGNTKR